MRNLRSDFSSSRVTMMALASCLVAVATPTSAHHSFIQYDGAKKTVISGTVTRYQWSNPHVWINLAVPNGKGAVNEYVIECPAIVGLASVGWTARTLHRGDKITLTIHPTRTPSFAGALYDATLADGTKLGQTTIQRGRYTGADAPRAK